MTVPLPSPVRGALSGAIAAASALAAGELVAVALGSDVTPITAVGSEFVDRYAASLKEIAVALFGTKDKVALVIGIVVVCVALGAILGVASRRFARAVPVGLGVFAALGAIALASDPQGSVAVAVASATIAVAVGLAVNISLWRAASDPVAEPEADTSGRRAFLVRSSAFVIASAVAVAVRDSVVTTRIADAARRITGLPVPRTRVPLPSATLDPSGASSYITPISDFYRIDTALTVPRVDVGTWRLAITGLVEEPIEIDYDRLLAMESVEVPVTIQCVSNEVGGDLVGTAQWQGVPLADVLALAGVAPNATQIVGRSVDGWTAGFPLADALDGRTAIVAFAMNGEVLPPDHGFPARLIVAGLYGYVSATKWLTELELTTWEAFDGYWVPRGWSKRGPIKLTSRIDVPRSSDRPAAGPITVAGVAWHPTIGVAKVEVQIDDGPWREAELGSVASTDTWVQWTLAWDATPGDHELRVRATGADGAVQIETERPPAPDGATGWHRRRVRVS